MIQQSCFDDLFYPGNKQELQKLILNLIETVPPRKEENIKGIIAPHAGYQYSGNIAAESLYQTHHKTYKTAIIIGPSHRFVFSGTSSLNKQIYQTPLGNVMINQKLLQTIRHHDNKAAIVYELGAYEKEHSIEVILPFLQVLHPNITIIPLVVGRYSLDHIETVANILVKTCDERETLVITSTDFSHFFSAEQAREKDLKAVEIIKKQAIGELIEEQKKQTIQLCGLGPLLIMLTLFKKWKIKDAEHLSYCHSGMISGDLTSVVGYNSFRFF